MNCIENYTRKRSKAYLKANIADSPGAADSGEAVAKGVVAVAAVAAVAAVVVLRPSAGAVVVLVA